MSDSDTIPAPPKPLPNVTAPVRPVLFLAMAVCAGATVANVYLAQPLLTLFAHGLGVSSSSAGIVVTCAQLGYAAGILFLVPLGDIRSRRPLLAVMLSGTVLALLLAAAAPALSVLAAAAALIGGVTVIPQVLVPLAAELAPPERRASVVANVQIGLMSGIIGSRVIGGLVGEALGWRAVYLLAAALTALSGLLTLALLPREGARQVMPYGKLLASLPALLRQEPALRHSLRGHEPLPAYVLDAHWNVLHRNQAMERWFPWLRAEGSNLLSWALFAPSARTVLHAWDEHAMVYLGIVRTALRERPDDPFFRAINAATHKDPTLHSMLARDDVIDVSSRSGHRFTLNLPQITPEPINVISHALRPEGNRGVRVVVLTSPHMPSEESSG
ncbi:putative transporter [Streptomyces hundungensis]|uniref:Putative transporter n=1 Tax=Streptomyces hundungensis TaxID=1077946 RepID=A0A387HG79_9ACTN|nr:MFS transporter [Streptomyces hundungensis]AYG79782.1 putative transporter [Streptomyces hundungensis]